MKTAMTNAMIKNGTGEGAIANPLDRKRAHPPLTPRMARVSVVLAAMLALSACQTVDGSLFSSGSSVSSQQTQDNAWPTEGMSATLLQAARESETKRDFMGAAGMYVRLADKHPNNALVLVALGRALRHGGAAQDAVDLFAQRAGPFAGNAAVTFEHGKTLLAANHPDQALAKLNEARTLDSGNWQVHSALGIARDSVGDYPRAWGSYDTALQLSPDNVQVLNNYAMSLAQADLLDDAIAMMLRAANRDRANVQVRQNLALLYAVSGDMDKARSLAAMDLEAKDLDTNMSFYSRFDGGLK